MTTMKPFNFIPPLGAWLALIAVTLTTAATARAEESSGEWHRTEAPAFSPDGREIVFVESIQELAKDGARLGSIWKMNSDGTGLQRLTSRHSLHEDPRFNPDGKSIVFLRNYDVWIMSSDGSSARAITNTNDAREEHPEFTNDGKNLVFVRHLKKYVKEVDMDIWAVSLVLRSLVDGREKVVLGDDYGVEQAIPHPTENGALLILCNRLDAKAKPIEDDLGSKVLASVKLDGTGLRTLYAPTPASKTELHLVRAAPTRTILSTRQSGDFKTVVNEWKDGKLQPIPNLDSAGDITRDGRRISYPAIVDDDWTWGVALLDLENGATVKFPGGVKRDGQIIASAAPAATIPNPASAAVDSYAKGVEHVRSGRFDEAIAAFTVAIKENPNNAAAFHRRALCLDTRKKTNEALKDLDSAIRIAPKRVEYYLARGAILIRQERLGEAMDDFTAAIKLDPRNATAFRERGEVQLKRLEPTEALGDFDASIRLEPNTFVTYLGRAEAHLDLNDRAAALADLTTAIRLEPDWIDSYVARARIYRAMGKTELAIADEKKAKELGG